LARRAVPREKNGDQQFCRELPKTVTPKPELGLFGSVCRSGPIAPAKSRRAIGFVS
jgi:hypothetical protein